MARSKRKPRPIINQQRRQPAIRESTTAQTDQRIARGSRVKRGRRWQEPAEGKNERHAVRGGRENQPNDCGGTKATQSTKQNNRRQKREKQQTNRTESRTVSVEGEECRELATKRGKIDETAQSGPIQQDRRRRLDRTEPPDCEENHEHGHRHRLNQKKMKQSPAQPLKKERRRRGEPWKTLGERVDGDGHGGLLVPGRLMLASSFFSLSMVTVTVAGLMKYR